MRWLVPIVGALAAIAVLVWLFGRSERPADPLPDRPGGCGHHPIRIAVFFDVDQSALPSSAQAELAPVIAHLNQNPNATAVVTAFTIQPVTRW